VRWLQELAKTVGRDIHRASLDLRPTALDDLGLRRALTAHVAAWSRRFGLVIDLQWHGPEERLGPELETALYRVVQEAVTNVVKHASARAVSIVIERQPGELRLLIEDDGRGFVSECGETCGAAGQARPLGLSGMRERVSLLDGDLNVETGPGAGSVAIVDDHAVVLAGVRALLQAAEGFDLVGEASSGAGALALIRETRPDVAVIDISLPDYSGLELAERLAEAAPGVKLLALTVHEDRAYVQPMLRAGVRGYLLKSSAAEDLLRAIRAVLAGGIYIDPLVAENALTGESTDPDRDGSEDLSPRELDVLRLAAQGYSNKEIAGRLDVSVKTVETYKARGCEKLGLRTRADIVRHGASRGWLDGLSSG
jgi:DNA-binding NarL/FixJ family response regulator